MGMERVRADLSALGVFASFIIPVGQIFLAAFMALPARANVPLSTLVTFIIGRALYDILVVAYGSQIQMSMASSDTWDFIGDGTVLGLSVPVLTALMLAVIVHVDAV